jgi:pyridoxine 5-phosphate synthase
MPESVMSMPTHLSVNVNAIAQLRNRRNLPWPSVEGLARIALETGAHGITVHPRPDERHIRRSDVPVLKQLVQEFGKGAEFNIEGYPDEDFLKLVEANRPDQVTLVPDLPGQATSDHGWDIVANHALLKSVIKRLKAGGMRVSLFADPDPVVAGLARDVGADRIELYTGPYGACHNDDKAANIALEALAMTAQAAQAAGLGVNAGHDLTVPNLAPLVERIPFLAEVSIGHAITGDALIHGMEITVKRYLKACGW